MPIEINNLEWPSDHVQAKINGKHHVSFDDVLDACENPERASWVDDERGRRLLVKARVRGHTLRIYLYPISVAEGTWRLGTAFFE